MNITKKIFYLFICCFCLIHPLKAGVVLEDSLALVALFNITNGPNWTHNENWLSGKVSTWYGIDVLDDYVLRLFLQNNNLNGTLPSEIGNFSNISQINITNNANLTGPIPAEIGNLNSLVTLELFSNSLTDTMPNTISNLVKLELLSLSGNELLGQIPPEIGLLENIKEINLQYNNLSGSIPAELAELDSLTYLDLENNELEGSIPIEIYNMIQLETLILAHNLLSGEIPVEIGNLNNLKKLDLSFNDFTGSIPPEIGFLTNLDVLYLHVNQLEGSIPVTIGNLTSLLSLDLASNNLSGNIPSEIGNLTNLTNLRLYQNNLDGSIPSEIGQLTNLSQLWLHSNRLTNDIPNSIINLTNIEYLYLLNNQLVGAVPQQITNLTKLNTFRIEQNEINEFPDITSIGTLNEVSVQNNKLTFEDIVPNMSIPIFTYSPQDSVGENQVYKIDKDSSLTISVSVGGMNNEYQWFKNDEIIPGATSDSYTINSALENDAGIYLCQITNPEAPDLILYSRPIIVKIKGFGIDQDSLALVALYNNTNGPNWTDKTNWLVGKISTWFGITISDDRVTRVNLSDNNLIGTIPSEIGNLTSLTELNIGNNQLVGSIPNEIYALSELEVLKFHSNQLEGAISTAVNDLVSLETFYIDNNQFTELPDLSTMTVITELRIQENKFTFEDIEPNISIPGFIYSPQGNVGEEMDTTITQGSSLNLSITVGGTANQYQWMKDGEDISGANSSLYTISSAESADDGSYVCKITNTIATELTLYSKPISVTVDAGTEITSQSVKIPEEFALYQNFPNPFNPVTTIRYAVPQSSDVSIELFNIVGEKVATILNDHKSPGYYEIIFDARNLSSGYYFYHFKTDGFRVVRKFVVTK